MKLGIGLPNTMALEIDRKLMLDWARLADEAGFHVLGTIDKTSLRGGSCRIVVARRMRSVTPATPASVTSGSHES